MEKKKIIDIITSVFIAIFLWAYVINVVNPPATTTISNVPIQLQNEEVLASSHLALSGSGNYTVSVVISGTRSDLNNISVNDLTATADLFGLSSGQNYLTISVTAPNNLSVESISPQRIQVYIEDLVTVNKPVVLTIGDVEEGYEVTMSHTGVSFIGVSGAKSVVNKVVDVYAELDPNDFPLDEIITLPLDAVPRDIDGNIVEDVKLSSNYVDVSGTVYAVKAVGLTVDLEGNPGYGAEVSSTGLPTRINVKGRQEDLSTLRSVSTKPIDIEGMTSDKTVKLVPILPDGIMLSDAEDSLRVTLKLTGTGATDLALNMESNVDFRNLEENCLATLMEGQAEIPLTAHIAGDLDDVMNAKAEDVPGYIDLSGITETGEYELKILPAVQNNGYSITYSPEKVLVYVLYTGPEETDENGEVPAEDAPVNP